MQIEQWQSPGVDAIQCAVSIVNIERVRYLKYNSMSKKMVACTLKQISMATHSHTNHAYTLAHTHTQRTRTHTHTHTHTRARARAHAPRPTITRKGAKGLSFQPNKLQGVWFSLEHVLELIQSALKTTVQVFEIFDSGSQSKDMCYEFLQTIFYTVSKSSARGLTHINTNKPAQQASLTDQRNKPAQQTTSKPAQQTSPTKKSTSSSPTHTRGVQ
jgi:hypothetical protein